MGVRQDYLKSICKELMSTCPERISIDFEENKEFLNENAEFHSKKIRNRIAGLLVTYKKNEDRILIPPYTGKPKKRKGWKKKEKVRARRRRR